MMRVLISFLLALVLALTSQSMAVARGSSAVAGQMVLCTGSGPVALYIDADGNPIDTPHICPDAAMNVVADLRFAGVSLMGRQIEPVTCAVLLSQTTPTLPRFGPPQRAPPLFV